MRYQLCRSRVGRRRGRGFLARLLFGGIAGAVGTLPMTALMEAGYRRLPASERYPLPPRQVVDGLAEQVDAPLPEDEERRVELVLAAHFAYGAAAGSLFALDRSRTARAGLLRGLLLGVVVWAGSYLGLLPALGVLRPATEHPPRRTLLMIAAHLVWGMTAGVVALALRRRC